MPAAERIPGFEILQRQTDRAPEMFLSDRIASQVPLPERFLTSMMTLTEFDDPSAIVRPGGPATPTVSSTIPDIMPSRLQSAVPAVAAEIVSQLRSGNRHFEIRLEPPELGRIEVKLDFRSDGSLAAKLVVERPETLDLLMRDARGLEKTLQAGGFKLDEGALEYRLRDQSAFEQRGQQHNDGGKPREREDEAPDDAQPQNWRRVSVGALDMRV